MLITTIKNAESLSIVKIKLLCIAGNSKCISSIWSLPESTSKLHTELNTITLVSNTNV